MFRNVWAGFACRVVAVLSFMSASTSCTDQLELGAACSSAEDCQSGHCEAFTDSGATGSVCTEQCANIGEYCASGLICRETGMCGPPCVGIDHDNGQACKQGISVDCETLDAVAGCLYCGCESYGGGECVAGKGCVFYASDGEPCGGNVLCESDVCDPESAVCIAPVERGEPCRYDEQCVTKNCSNDARRELDGVCNQRLATLCDGNDTCSDCVGYSALEYGLCMRSPCDDDVAPCPGGWACLEATNGQNRCFQRCSGSTYCEAGVCQGGYCQGVQ